MNYERQVRDRCTGSRITINGEQPVYEIERDWAEEPAQSLKLPPFAGTLPALRIRVRMLVPKAQSERLRVLIVKIPTVRLKAVISRVPPKSEE